VLLHAIMPLGGCPCFFYLLSDRFVCVCLLIEQRVHCGCIVSIHKYQLRDAGGVDCAKCARNTRTAMVCRENFHCH
jgi:hypothetical protein